MQAYTKQKKRTYTKRYITKCGLKFDFVKQGYGSRNTGKIYWVYVFEILFSQTVMPYLVTCEWSYLLNFNDWVYIIENSSLLKWFKTQFTQHYYVHCYINKTLCSRELVWIRWMIRLPLIALVSIIELSNLLLTYIQITYIRMQRFITEVG